MCGGSPLTNEYSFFYVFVVFFVFRCRGDSQGSFRVILSFSPLLVICSAVIQVFIQCRGDSQGSFFEYF